MLTSLTNRVNTFLLVLLVLMAGSIIAILASRAGAGPLDPPAPPTSTVPQVEPRMPIPPVGWNGTFPIVISQPGSYFFTRDITGVASNSGIDVRVSHVTIDLNGFALLGVAGSYYGMVDCGLDGIGCGAPPEGLEVRNGTISGWGQAGIVVTSTGNGTYRDLRLSHNGWGGIRTGGNDLIINVTAFANTAVGIELGGPDVNLSGGIVRDSTAYNNAGDGIRVHGQALVLNNSSYGNTGSGISLSHSNNRVESNNVANNSQRGIVAAAGSTANVVVRNTARFNGLSNYLDTTTTNDFGPIDIASSATSPWANISH